MFKENVFGLTMVAAIQTEYFAGNVAKGKWREWWLDEANRISGTFEAGGVPRICIMEVLTPNYPRSWIVEFHYAEKRNKRADAQKSIRCLLKGRRTSKRKHTWRSLLAGNKEHWKQKWSLQSPFCSARTYWRRKNMLLHNFSNVKKQSIRVLIGLAAILGFRVWTQDVSQAYLQRASELTRKVCVQPKGSFIGNVHELLRLLKTLYGLRDNGDYCHIKMTNHLRHDLRITPLTRDPTCPIRCLHERLQWKMGLHLDESIEMENKDFFETSRLAEQCFESRPHEYENTKLAGISTTKKGKCYLLHQTVYASNLREFSPYCYIDRLRARRQEIAWLTHTRSALCARVAMMPRVTAEKSYRATLELASFTVKVAKDRNEWGCCNIITTKYHADNCDFRLKLRH